MTPGILCLVDNTILDQRLLKNLVSNLCLVAMTTLDRKLLEEIELHSVFSEQSDLGSNISGKI